MGNGGDRVPFSYAVDRAGLLTGAEDSMRNAGIVSQAVLPLMGRKVDGVSRRDILKPVYYRRPQGGIELMQEIGIQFKMIGDGLERYEALGDRLKCVPFAR